MTRIEHALRRHVGVLVLVVAWLLIALLFPTRPDGDVGVGRTGVPQRLDETDSTD